MFINRIEKNAFTLIELLSVIVIFGITFMFILPSLVELFTMGNKTEIELIEERVLSAAKGYVNNIDGTFYKSFYKTGDVNYIYKSDLINANLIAEEEISKLDTFVGVKGELLSNDRMKYTVEYIKTEGEDYSNQNLYSILQELSNNLDELNKDINDIEESATFEGNITDLRDKVNDNASLIGKNKKLIENNNKSIIDLTNKDSDNNVFLKNYPVGSIYISVNNVNPADLFGGTWVQIKDRFLLGAGDTYQAGSTGGSSTHQHLYGFQYGGYYRMFILENNSNAGLLNYSDENNFTVTGSGTSLGTFEAPINTIYSNEYSTAAMNHYRMTAKTSASSSLPPYLAVNIWKRTA